MIYTEFTGKTVDEAVEKGLSELGLTRENADIRVLEEGKKKLFGAVKARVEIAAKACDCEDACEDACEDVCDVDNGACEDACDGAECEMGAPVIEVAPENATDGERTVIFLEGLFKILKITACTELVSEDEKVEINVTAANTTSIIGKHGVMLDAIQTLAGAVANTGREDYKRVVVDCENYRENREATLNKLAENLAAKAVRLGKKLQLEPMNPYERRIIHAALSEKEDVKTESEGKEPNRYIVIIPANLEDPDAPAIPARTERDRHGRGGYNNRGGRGRDRGFGGRNDRRGGKGGFGKKPFNRDRKPSGGSATGGTSLKSSGDFFGIFLGNSGNTEDKE